MTTEGGVSVQKADEADASGGWQHKDYCTNQTEESASPVDCYDARNHAIGNPIDHVATRVSVSGFAARSRAVLEKKKVV